MVLAVIGGLPLALGLSLFALLQTRGQSGPARLAFYLLLASAVFLLPRLPFPVFAAGLSLIWVAERSHAIRRANASRKQAVTQTDYRPVMKSEFRLLRECGLALLFVYLLAVFYLTFHPFEFRPAHLRTLHMSLVPFEEISRQFRRTPGLAAYYMFGNIAMTVPLGVFLPLLAKRMRHWLAVMAAGFAFSLAIELSQMLFASRSAEIDDLIFNTVGASLGYGLFWSVSRLLGLFSDGRDRS